MTKPRINPAAIGIFIAGAIVILFASIVLFGSGRFFRETKDVLLTFREPVTGLDVGAPVKLLGVTIGGVKQINIEIGDDSTNALLINVVIEIDLERAASKFGNRSLDLTDRAVFTRSIHDKGIRGQLDMLSMLSGQLYIALDMFPDEEGFQMNRESEHGYWEIPTIPSAKRQLMQSAVTSLGNFAQFDFKGMSEQLQGLLVDVRKDLAQMELARLGTNLTATIREAKELLGDPELKAAITNMNGALNQVQGLLQSVNKNITPLVDQVDSSLAQAQTTFQEAAKTLRSLQGQFDPSSTLSRELIRTLEQAGAALSAIRQLAQELERNPSSLITGKKEPKP